MTGLAELSGRLQVLAGLEGKRDIQAPARIFPHLPFPELGVAAALGDDAALLPPAAGPLLLACEGLHPGLVDDDPWFAGWSGVLVNLSDIAAMGGRPLAVVNSLWSRDPVHTEALLEGMRFASGKFAIPVVGGHTNQHSPYNALSVAVLGLCRGAVLSARAACPGDHLCLLINTSGRFYRHYPFWDAATEAEPALLRAQLGLMAELAETSVVHAAKDISMGGLVGTAVMFAEAAGCRLQLHLDAITPPAGVALEAWLSCFPSYGYLLAARSDRLQELHRRVAPHPDLHCAEIGRFAAGEAEVHLHQGDQCSLFWSGADGLTGFGARPGQPP